MQLLPDRNFRSNYKKRYDTNYEKLMQRKKARSIQKASKTPCASKQTLLGCIVCVCVFVFLGIVGLNISSLYNEREFSINELAEKIRVCNDAIRQFQTVDADAKKQQTEEALVYVTEIQNMRLNNAYSADYDIYAVRYLSQYNTDWSADCATLTKAIWSGYIDFAYDDVQATRMCFILSDNGCPVKTVVLYYTVDRFGNLETVIRMDEMVFL